MGQFDYLAFIEKKTGLLIDLKHKMTCLDLLRCLSPDSQIPTAAKMYGGSILNIVAFAKLSIFVGHCVISVRPCTVGRYGGPQYTP